ncbi:hypothetical protein [Acidaminococcus fermentans]|uniref:hypothetical protein n=1 Tax=Acidaminococcus fermentans TaxID=905 RepID=UPI003F8BB0F2
MMKFGKKTMGLLLSVGLLLGTGVGVTPAHAYVEDAGVLNNFHTDRQQPMWDYINSHNYRFFNKDSGSDYYITKDNTTFMAISNGNIVYGWAPGVLQYLIFLKPGPKTDLGIQVGDSVKTLIATYGSAHPTTDANVVDNQPRMGYYQQSSAYKIQTRSGWKPVYIVTYFDRNRHHLDFMVGTSNNRIMAILYCTSGSTTVIGDMYDADNFRIYMNRSGLGYYL